MRSNPRSLGHAERQVLVLSTQAAVVLLVREVLARTEWFNRGASIWLRSDAERLRSRLGRRGRTRQRYQYKRCYVSVMSRPEQVANDVGPLAEPVVLPSEPNYVVIIGVGVAVIPPSSGDHVGHWAVRSTVVRRGEHSDSRLHSRCSESL